MVSRTIIEFFESYSQIITLTMFIRILGTRIILLRSVVPVVLTEIQFRDSINLFLVLKKLIKTVVNSVNK